MLFLFMLLEFAKWLLASRSGVAGVWAMRLFTGLVSLFNTFCLHQKQNGEKRNLNQNGPPQEEIEVETAELFVHILINEHNKSDEFVMCVLRFEEPEVSQAWELLK